MKAMAELVRTSIRAFLRDRGAVFWQVAFPLILMGLIGLAFGRQDTSTLSVSLVDAGNPQLVTMLETGLRSVPTFRVFREPRAEALQGVREGRRTLVVLVPPQATTLEAFYDQGRPQTAQAALAAFQRFVAEANLKIAGATPFFRVRATAVQGKEMRFFDFLLPGIVAMTIGQAAFMGVTPLVAEMRESQLLRRVLSTPVPRAVFLGGLLFRTVVTMLFQALLVFLVGTFAFGARTQGSVAELGLLTLCGAVAFSALGCAVSTVTRTSDAARALGSVVWFPMMFLSGTFWPREMMPEAIRPVIAYLPLSPLLDAMRAVGASGEPLAHHLGAVGSLLAVAVVAFAVAVRRLRWE
jgi:ABC-2 type transport system permease protein